MALFWHGIAVGLDLSPALVWPTDELFNINSNINIIMGFPVFEVLLLFSVSNAFESYFFCTQSM